MRRQGAQAFGLGVVGFAENQSAAGGAMNLSGLTLFGGQMDDTTENARAWQYRQHSSLRIKRRQMHPLPTTADPVEVPPRQSVDRGHDYGLRPQ